ncbi:DUF1761 domain-containing protein [Massilia sp. CF038]|uniref:DUF1761 domain-containing protein n=1 Tax=Massilia sp. CF038 TaxID=1881045 RepID=UPI0015B47403|nr:DUF1761 domain-containing protein [Massilia sp. CF038]
MIASVAHFALGGVWFGLLFGKQYAAALGIADRPPQQPAPLFLIGPFVCSAVTIATTAFLLQSLHIGTYGDAMVLATLVAIGYLTPMTLNIAINPLFPRPFYYALINAPMFLIGSLVACAILVWMSQP